jgi:hypothetical protein
MKFSIISGVAAAALELSMVAAFAQTTVTPGSGLSSGVKPPPDVYNNSTVGPAGSSKSQSGQYTQGNSQSLMPSSAAGQAEQTGPTPAKSQ